MHDIVSVPDPKVQDAISKALTTWQEKNLCQRIWNKDHTVWSADPKEISNRLGWLDLPIEMRSEIPTLQAFADEVRNDGITDVVLLGMGGSSLAPEVFATTFGSAPGYPTLSVLDSTHPDAVRAVEARIDLAKTLFIVASKSGTTLETLSFFRTFWDRVSATTTKPGAYFVAITDPGSSLETIANERGFRRVFAAPPTVGGRYSALSVFGMVPAALIGADIVGMLDNAAEMVKLCSPELPVEENVGVVLGVALAELAKLKVDKVTFLTSPKIDAFPAWIEQLIAESVGKDGKCIVPTYGETLPKLEHLGTDRVFVDMTFAGEDDVTTRRILEKTAAASYPLVRAPFKQPIDLGGQIFLWEFTTAVAGASFGINPFNQPDVQLAKELAKAAMAKSSEVKPESDQGFVPTDDESKLLEKVRDWAQPKDGDYLAIHAYLAPTDATTSKLEKIRDQFGTFLGVAATVEYGPRFLHSTGQLHKGGANNGLFLQLVDEPTSVLPVPETDFTFNEVIAAQAAGDREALKQRDRRVLSINLGTDSAAGLNTIANLAL